MWGNFQKLKTRKITFFCWYLLQGTPTTPPVAKLMPNDQIYSQKAWFMWGDTTWADWDLPTWVGKWKPGVVHPLFAF